MYHKNFMLGQGNTETTDKTSSLGVRGKTATIGANTSEGGDQMSMVTNSQKKRNQSSQKQVNTLDNASYAGSTRNQRQSEFGGSSRRQEGQDKAASTFYKTYVIVRMVPEKESDNDISLNNIKVLDN